MDLGHWQYPDQFDTTDWFGFIYRIIDTNNKKQYIGKKQFFAHTTKKIKDRKNRKHIHKPSDWKTYTGSSINVNNAITEKGKDTFIFIIESLQKSKASLHYEEVRLQVKEDVLRSKFDNGERRYYNGCIAGVKFLPPDEISDETRARISVALLTLYEDKDNFWYNKLSDIEKTTFDENFRIGHNNSTRRGKTEEEYTEWVKNNYVGEHNPMYGRSGQLSPRYGKSPYDNLSDERIAAIKQILSIRNTGEGNPRYGKDPHENMSAEELTHMKEKLSERMSGENNPMFGIPCTYKMTKEEKERWKKNIGDGVRGKTRSTEVKKNMSAAMTGIKKTTVKCPHCNKEGGSNNMYRYHFDKCKYRPIV